MTYLSYVKINALEEFSLIAGTDFVLVFDVFDEDGSPVDLGGGTVKWVLSPMGQPDYNVLELDGTFTSSSQFEIQIPASATEEFSGKYIHQPVLTDFSEKQFRPAQGVITIIARIPLL